MAHGEKYFHAFCDPYDNSYRISIQKKDYTEPVNLIPSALSDSDWVKNNLILDAFKIIPNNSISAHWATLTFAKTAESKTYTFKFQTRRDEYSTVYIRFSTGGSKYLIIYYNSFDNTFSNLQQQGGYTITSNIGTALADNWFECEIILTTSADVSMDVVLGVVSVTGEYIFGGNNVSGLEIKDVSLQEGSGPIELEGQPNPILIKYDNSDDDKFKPIIPSSAVINLALGTGNGVDFEEFWDANEKTFKIVYTKNSNVIWTGFVIPDGFAYDLQGGVYYATINANDGLDTLEGLLFKDPNTNGVYGLTDLTYNNGFEFPFVLIATEILRKLEFDIDTWTLVDVYEKNMTDLDSDSRNSDPLAISYVNTKTYINESKRNNIPYFEDVGEVWNCKKVMENLLEIWGCKLYQEDGVWKIKRVTVDAKYGFVYPEDLGGEYFYKASFNNEITDPAEAVVVASIFSVNKGLYSVDNVLIVGSYCTNASGGTKADEGYYKLVGIDKIVHIDSTGEVDTVYTYTHPVYYWHKYNTLAGYIGREQINDTITIDCNNLIGTDHEIRMDRVYKQFRVNYERAFIREGDTPINLIKNGNFAEDYDQYGQLESPPNWERWRAGKKWYPRLRTETLTGSDITDSGGNTHAIRFGQQFNNLNTKNTDPNPAIWADLRQSSFLDSTVKAMKLSLWVKYKYKGQLGGVFFGNKDIFYYPVLKCFFEENVIFAERKIWNLVNDKEPKKLKWKSQGAIGGFGGFNDLFYNTGDFFICEAKNSVSYVDSEDEDYKWYLFEYDVEPPQVAGNMIFSINGICASLGKKTANFPPFQHVGYSKEVEKKYFKPTVNGGWIDKGGSLPRPMFTGIEFGYIPDPTQEVPADDYIYANEDIDFTYQDDPIEVFNGDTNDPEILSGIIVPLNNTGDINKWDTSDKDFGYTQIGMIAAKAIMSQYSTISRLFEGVVKSDNVKYGTRFSFDAIPDILFILLRVSFNHKRGYIEDATFAQISSDALAVGGAINGNTLNPIYVPTGNTRCVKDVNGENTGESELEQIDSNYNSETYGVLRWISGGTDIVSCPIGEPSKYYWGTDDAAYNLSNFTDYTVEFEEDNIVQVSFSNVGGKYIYFLHLSSLGTVNRVANDFQYNIISSFQYLADVMIDGYLYRVLRQDFVTSQFEGFTLTFDFN